MNQSDIDQIIDFINKIFDEEIPRPVKFVVRRKAKKIEKIDLNEFPEPIRKCTLEEFLTIVQTAYKEKKLNF